MRRILAAEKCAVSALVSQKGCSEVSAHKIVQSFFWGRGPIGLTAEEASHSEEVLNSPETLGDVPQRALAYGAWLMAEVHLQGFYKHCLPGSAGFFKGIERVIAVLDCSIQIFSKNVGSHCSLAYTWCLLGGAENAAASLAACAKALELDSNYAEAWRIKATALTLLGERLEAKTCLEKAMALNPFLIVPRELRKELGV